MQGWDTATVVAVRTHNLIAALIQGLSGKENPDMFIDYPGAKTHEVQPETLADITIGGFNQFMYG